jgi:hypothetical protein
MYFLHIIVLEYMRTGIGIVPYCVVDTGQLVPAQLIIIAFRITSTSNQ